MLSTPDNASPDINHGLKYDDEHDGQSSELARSDDQQSKADDDKVLKLYLKHLAASKSGIGG